MLSFGYRLRMRLQLVISAAWYGGTVFPPLIHIPGLTQAI